MKSISLLIHAIIVLVLSVPVALLILTLDEEPAVPAETPLSQVEAERIQQLLIDNDPKLLLDQQTQSLTLSEAEVNALLTYFVTHIPELKRFSAQAELREQAAEIALTLAVPSTPFGEYVNMHLELEQQADSLRLETLRVGALGMPGESLIPLLALIRHSLEGEDSLRLFNSVLATINSVQLTEAQVEVGLNWQKENLREIRAQARRLFINEAEQLRLLAYYEEIARVAAALPIKQRTVNLNEFLRPLFSLALENSQSGADPQTENRSVFIAMAIYLTDLELDDLLDPDRSKSLPRPRKLNVVVQRRPDLAQHIMGSAAIAASAGAEVADLLSIYKEVHDSRYRSGFSFSDITANQVGAALGNLSSAGTPQARRLQEILSTSQDAADYMPAVESEDGMTEQEFIARYQNRHSEHYAKRLAQIQAAIQQRPVFQAFNQPLDFTPDAAPPD